MAGDVPPEALPMAGSRTWVDPRFGFRVPVPSAMWVTPTSDRATFNSGGGVELVVWGENSPKSKRSAEADLRALGAQITTSVGTDSAYSISGYLGDDIFYQRVLSGPRSSNWIYWQYPSFFKSSLDRPVTRSVDGFVAGDLTTTH